LRISQANRGKVLEDLISWANNQYKAKGIAFIKKFPTPIRPLKVKGSKIEGFFEEKSALDYIGVYRGIPIAFDAKETRETEKFPLKNIQEHQVDFMEQWTKNGGQAFLIISFVKLDKIYRLHYQIIRDYWEAWQQNRGKPGYASIPILEFERKATLVEPRNGIILDYLSGVS